MKKKNVESFFVLLTLEIFKDIGKYICNSKMQ